MNYKQALTMKPGDVVQIKASKELVRIESVDEDIGKDYRGVRFYCSDGNNYYHTTVIVPKDK